MDNFNNSFGIFAGMPFFGSPEQAPSIDHWIGVATQMYDAGSLVIWYPFDSATGDPVNYEKGVIRFSNGAYYY